jgi:thiamine biosynthesis lipoprotein
VIRHTEEVMGTVVSFAVQADELSASAVRMALRTSCATLHRADAIFSTFKHGSPVSRMRRGEIAEDDAPDEVREVLRLCRTVRELSGGWFDPWSMPGGVDPTGVVKGWAAARALDDLRAAGAAAAMVNAAGDLAVFGTPEGGRAWRAGIADPRQPGSLAWTAEVAGAMATSGSAEQGAHIFDPRSRAVTGRVLSATVTGPDLAIADGLATAVAAGGQEAFERVAGLEGYEAMCLDRSGAWTATDGFEGVPAAPERTLRSR